MIEDEYRCFICGKPTDGTGRTGEQYCHWECYSDERNAPIISGMDLKVLELEEQVRILTERVAELEERDIRT